MAPTLLPSTTALLAAFLYVIAVLSLKRAAELGVGLWHSTLVSNLMTGVAFQGLLFFGGTWPPFSQWWQPALVASLLLSGQVWTLLSLQKGDVSVATPVLGLKIVLVALFSTSLLGQHLGWHLWLAAALATTGVALLSQSGAKKEGGDVRLSIVSAALAALSLAVFDVLVQKWSPIWGLGRFLPVCLGMMAVISLAIIPLCPSPLKALPHPSLRWLNTGSFFFALQSLVFVSSIAYFQQATVSNIVYSSRGLWSLLAVVFLGHLFHSAEQKLSPRIMRWRFSGAVIMFAAIVLARL